MEFCAHQWYRYCSQLSRHCFPIDCDSSLVLPVDDPSFAVTQFLALSQSTRSIATSVISFLLDECCTAYGEQVNAFRIASSFRLNDIVTARIQQQSNSSLCRVQKLLYIAKGPFCIIKDCNFGSFKVCHVDKPAGPLLKFHARDLFLLPPLLQPFQPPDQADLRYLNLDIALLPHLLNALALSSYNSRWFDQPISSLIHSNDSAPSLSPFPSISGLRADHIAQLKNPNTCPKPSVPLDPASAISIPACLVPPSATSLFSAITSPSSDRQFFIAHSSPFTIRKLWHIVQVDLSVSACDSDSRDHETSGVYYVEFLAKVSHDLHLPDSAAQWWLDWWAFFTDCSDDLTLSSHCTEFCSTCTVNLKMYTPYGLPVNLLDPAVFNFHVPSIPKQVPHTHARTHQDTIPVVIWRQLFDLSAYFSLSPPSIAPTSPSSTVFASFVLSMTLAHPLFSPSRTCQRQSRDYAASSHSSAPCKYFKS